MSREEMELPPRAPLIASPVASLLLAAACAPSHEVQAADVPNLPTNPPREQKQGISSQEQFMKEQGLTVTGVLSHTEVSGGGVLLEPPEAEPGEGETPPSDEPSEPPNEPPVDVLSSSSPDSSPAKNPPEGEPEPAPAPEPLEVVAPPDTSALEWLKSVNVGTWRLDNWGFIIDGSNWTTEQKQISSQEKTFSRSYIRKLGQTIRRIGDPELARMIAHIVQGNEDESIQFVLIPSFQVTNLPEHFTPFGLDIGNSGATRLRISGGQIKLERFAPDKYDGVFWVNVSEAVINTYQDRRDAGEDIIAIYSSKRNVVDAVVDALKRALANFNGLKSRLQRLGISWSTSTGGSEEWSRFFDANQNNPLALRQRVNKDLAIGATPQELR